MVKIICLPEKSPFMELKSTINIILKDLEDARALIDDLRNYQGVPLIQIELARAKCRSAEDVIRLLSSLLEEKMAATAEGREGSLSDMVTETDEAHHAEVSGAEAFGSDNRSRVKESGPFNSGESEKHHFAKSDETDNNHSFITTEAPQAGYHQSAETPEIKDQPAAEDTEAEDQRPADLPAAKDNFSTRAPEIKDQPAAEDPEAEDHYSPNADNKGAPQPENRSPRIVADRFSHLSERINEQIGDSKNGSQDSTRVKKNITDITREIGINDRFFLIREMFGGNQERYASALNELNRVQSNEEAKEIIERYSTGGGDREAGRMLSELVKRKLSSTHG
jgi:hypothetical protein